MNNVQLFFAGALLALFIGLNRLAGSDACAHCPGGLPLYVWPLALVSVGLVGFVFARLRVLFAHRLLTQPVAAKPNKRQQQALLTNEQRLMYDPEGPAYPHPVIVVDRCISCHQCIEACPHDVLTMGYLRPDEPVAFVAAPDLCMEDTSCQSVCPVPLKACIVVNTEKVIRSPKVPVRNEQRMSQDLPGCYIVGDVSGTPLIKNAINEGAEVIKHIAAELQAAPDSAGIPFDVVIIGAGPAGLSAALTARQLNLRFVGVEQQQVLATIESFGKNKYVHFKPAHIKASGGLVIEGKGQQCAQILVAWKQAVNKHKIMLNPPVREECAAAIYENERCTNIERGADGDYLIVTTERPREGRAQTYRTRRVVLAIGQRGAPLKLNNPKNFVPGEDLSITRKQPDGQLVSGPKVLYELSNPQAYQNFDLVVVGGGNSAVEAAVDLVVWRADDQIRFRAGAELNRVTMLVRGPDFKTDVKFGNKQQLYQCMDHKLITVLFDTEVTAIRDRSIVFFDAQRGKEHVLQGNDYIFALIGSERPDGFLKQIKIEVK